MSLSALYWSGFMWTVLLFQTGIKSFLSSLLSLILKEPIPVSCLAWISWIPIFVFLSVWLLSCKKLFIATDCFDKNPIFSFEKSIGTVIMILFNLNL